jgi:hypothetical protein
MPRLIDADVLKQDINNVSTHWLNEWSTLGVLAMVDKQPSCDAVPVCRCKDCSVGMCYSDGSVQCEWSNGFYADDYCPHGERKGGGE